MFDTMTMTKVVGAGCGALLIFLLGKWAAEEIYSTSGYGDQQAYIIDTGADDDIEAAGDEDEAAGEDDFAALLAAADPDQGQRGFRVCAACHSLEEGRNGAGPSLYGVVGRQKGQSEGFRYSAVMSGSDEIWTPENLSAFIENPRGYAPGTSMAYAGMRDAEDRANLIAYLATHGD